MPRKRKIDLPEVRAARSGDAEELAEFGCSAGAECEDEVEAFIRTKALARVGIESPSPYRLLVAEDEGQIVGCAAFHEEPLILTAATEQALSTTRFHLLAVRLDQRGRELDDGSRLADFLFDSVVLKAFEEDGYGVLTALVARDNARSIAVCERKGLTNQIIYDDRLIRMLGTYVIG